MTSLQIAADRLAWLYDTRRAPDAYPCSRTLVASGAHALARKRGIETVDPTCMVSPRAREDWQRWRARYDSDRDVVGSTNDAPPGGAAVLPQDAIQDTVGAVVWDSEGNLAAGVSRFVD